MNSISVMWMGLRNREDAAYVHEDGACADASRQAEYCGALRSDAPASSPSTSAGFLGDSPSDTSRLRPRPVSVRSDVPRSGKPRAFARSDPDFNAPRFDAGSMSIEAVLIIPAFLLFLVALAAVGRVTGVQQDIHSAAVQAARVASLESSSSAGTAAGYAAANSYLAREKVPCQEARIEVNAAALDLPPGHPGAVSARVLCIVSLAEFTRIGMPGQFRVEAEFTAQIDAYVDR